MLTDDSIQSQGGKARAESLPEDARKAIAAQGAAARWGRPVAYFEGDMDLGNTKINCAVVEVGKDVIRLINSAGLMTALGRPWKGSYKRTERPNFLEANNLKRFISHELDGVLEPIEYRTPSGGTKSGYRAEIIPLVCDVYLSARADKALTASQQKTATACEIIVRSLAKLGIVALVDEATGYQEVRDRMALQKILEKYITDEWAKWTRRFPNDFYRHLFRLKRAQFPPAEGKNTPSYVGHWTNDIVYTRLAPGILKKLKEVNPKTPSGHRARKHHQHLTEDVGVPELQQHLSNVIFLMKACQSWSEFKQRLDIAAPKFGDTMSLNLLTEPKTQ